MRRTISVCALPVILAVCTGANYRTQNFLVEAPTPAVAKQVAGAAEQWRARLAVEWLGKELPTWPLPCHVSVRSAPDLAPNGRTRLLGSKNRTVVWEISLEGPMARILDSVLPHEMTHAVFATHFRRPLPRWADEGASTIVEHETQRAEQQRRLTDVLLSGTAVPMAELILAGDDLENTTAAYVQGYSLTEFLLAHGDKQRFVSFLQDGVSGAAWAAALHDHYGIASLEELQLRWLQWALPGR